MIYFPILAAIALAGGTVFEREILKRKSISIEKYLVLGALVMIVLMTPLLYFFWKIDPQALELKNIFIFILVIVSSILAHMFTFYSVKGEKINNLEPAKMLEPLFTILLALLFSVLIEGIYESNTKIILPSLIAGITLILSHVEKEHLNINKYFLAAIIGSLFFAVEVVLSMLILNFYSPITFHIIRCIGIFIFGMVIFRPKLSNVNPKIKIHLIILGVIWVVYRIITYYGYIKIGIISTTLILMLGPIFIYTFAKIFLKEKINKRNIISSVIILACVAYAMFG
jgi:drug/metabolite transporter (DMT)-like permease